MGHEERKLEGTIAFSTVGRSNYAFDLFSLPVTAAALTPSSHFEPLSLSQHDHQLREVRLTNSKTVGYNGHIVEPGEQKLVLEQLKVDGFKALAATNHSLELNSGLMLAYVSEDDGSPQIHISFNGCNHGTHIASENNVVMMDTVFRTVTPALKDKPSIAGGRLVYVSTQEPSGRARNCWNAVYSIDLKTGITTRITPPGVADFSPAISPSGQLLVKSFALPAFSGNLEDVRKLCNLTGIHALSS